MAQNPRRTADMLPNAATHPQFLRSQAARNDAASSSGQVSCHGDSLFATPAGVISLLRRYREVFDPKTTSVLLVSRQGFDPSQGPFRAGLLSRLDEREVLRRRMTEWMAERDRKMPILWFVVACRPA